VTLHVIAATNRNLKEDLLHRLNVFPINLPPPGSGAKDQSLRD
jgi:transcriptional regulator with GAF, ATPase, and Fis domain